MDDTEVVFLKVDPGRALDLGKRATACETLLGFVPGHFLPGDKRIMVAGTISAFPLYKSVVASTKPYHARCEDEVHTCL